MEALLGIIPCLGIFAFVLFFFIVGNIKQINQYQRAVLFSQGKFSKVLDPGWHFIIPIFQSINIVDMRVKAVDVEGQDTMTKDNVSVHMSAVIYYKVSSAEKAVIEVQNVDWAISQLAQTTMRNVIGEATLDEVLAHRDELSKKIEKRVDTTTEEWGVIIDNVELKDFILPESLKRTMAKVAEADREKSATIIKAEGEVIAAKNLAKASEMMSKTPGALHLRTLNTLNDLSSDQSNTVVMAVPIEVLRAFERVGIDELVKNITADKSK